jgi:hypothetical protein
MILADDTDPRVAPPSGRVASDNGMRALRMRQPCGKLSQSLHAELSVQRPSCLSSKQSGPALLPSPYHQWIQLCCPCIAHLQAMFLPRCHCHTHGVRWGEGQVQNDALPGMRLTSCSSLSGFAEACHHGASATCNRHAWCCGPLR